jgi:AcrR family transcriptional regulator
LPKVDRAIRRNEVCEIAARLIGRAGFDAVTFRDIAQEAGCSTRFISHYFASKDELLREIFLQFSQRSLDRCEAALAGDGNLAAALEYVLPLDDERRMFWQVWIAFWGRIIGGPELRETQVQRGRQMRAAIERLIVAKDGVPVGSPVLRFEAEQLLTVIVGIAMQGTFDPDAWGTERQRGHLRASIRMLRQHRHLG